MAQCCCLCRVTFNEASKKKRKRLHGLSAEGAKVILERLCAERGQLTLQQYKETSCPHDSFLCHVCEGKLVNIAKLEKLKSEVGEHLSQLHVIEPTRASGTLGQKRPTTDDGAGPSAAKMTKVQDRGATQSDAVTEQSGSPTVSVTIGYPSGSKNYQVKTPVRKMNVKKLARRSYPSLCTSVVQSSITSRRVVNEVARKIRDEMKQTCSLRNDSILRDTMEAVNRFSWETVWGELETNVPTLVSLLNQLISKPDENKPLICLIAAMLLKRRSSNMALVQRAISILLYGNGASKQVYKCLQQMMVCLSHTGTLKLVDRLGEDHDIEPQFWGDDLQERVQAHEQPQLPHEMLLTGQTLSELVEPWESDDDSPPSIAAPPYSPVSEPLSSSGGDEKDNDSENEENQDEMDTRMEATDAQMDSHHGVEQSKGGWSGFKLVGDNIDKNVRPSYQRSDRRTQSFHHFHAYAVQDRVNLSPLSESPRPYSEIDAASLLPSEQDFHKLRQDTVVLVSRVLVQHMEEFRDQADKVLWHIPSRHQQEMSSKSKVVPLGIFFHDENKLDEMCKIMEELHKYVPTDKKAASLTLPDGSSLDYEDTTFFNILFGGDQLTVARARGAKALRANHETATDRLEGLSPVIEDWHARQTLMKVIWVRLYSSKSSSEKGTLFQLRNLVNRSAVPPDPASNMKAAEDFLLAVLHAHIVAAAQTISAQQSVASVEEMATSVVTSLAKCWPEQEPQSKDGVMLYATEVLTLGLLWHGFHDAIREGDGDRVLTYRKFLLVAFKAANRHNYSKEALNLLVQHQYSFSERQSAQLVWSRFVNTKGRVGCNIPCDLHLEHLNRRLKTVLTHLHANMKPSAIKRAAKSIGVVHNICCTFEREMKGTAESDCHPYPLFGTDYDLILNTLQKEQIFSLHAGREYTSFKRKSNLLQCFSHNELSEWTVGQLKKFHFV